MAKGTWAGMVLVLALGCSQRGGGEDAGPPPCENDGHVSPLHFQDKTAEYGLSDPVALGNRIQTPDLDEDGYPDLVLEKVGGQVRTDFSADAGPPAFFYRVFMNRARQGGGREFVEFTQESGLGLLRSGETGKGRPMHLAGFADLNNDGHLDAFTGAYTDPNIDPLVDTGDRSEVMLGDGHGHFSLAPQLPAVMLGKNTVSGATFVDVQRDGLLDIYVGHWYANYGQSYMGMQNRLLMNQGDGTFTDGTAETGLTTSGASNSYATFTNHRPSYGVTACDIDGDGDGDLLVSAYGRQLNQLFMADQGSYLDVGRESGYAADDKKDYTDNEFYRCYCQQTGACSAPAPVLNCPSNAWSPTTDQAAQATTTVCADFNDDGKMDIYNAEIHHWWAGSSSDSSELLVQDRIENGVPVFTRPGNSVTGLTLPHVGVDWNEGGLMATAGDLDNDGRLDLLVAFSDYPDQFGLLFHQRSDGTFEEVGAAAGVHHPCLAGLALADVDRDGDLDILAASGTARDCAALWTQNEVHLYENQSGNTAHALQLVLEGLGAGGANRSAVGARVSVTAGGRTQTRERQASYGHFGIQNDAVMLVGLAESCQADVTVRWPNGALTTQTYTGLRSRQRLHLKEGEANASVVP